MATDSYPVVSPVHGSVRGHPPRCVEQLKLPARHLVLDDKGSVADAPQSLPDPECGEQVAFGLAEPERRCGGRELVGLLSVDDARGAVRQESLGEGACLAVGVSDGIEVG